ncbi:autotransporter-associated beta strand repeat protein [Pirellula staleyi DSM 6068]|uniref:Autotransporter-associated beta strand repeat protein n=1 Tax=Pirellula staleyi (strain ATCC 27377 / DSM 6068 / ICPB 4128) TaxID=530564 RepID=D2R8H7_PIRSD|nr:autotransporter-associated beta strand repeat protein [Pirellula staleyi DSM 6068]
MLATITGGTIAGGFVSEADSSLLYYLRADDSSSVVAVGTAVTSWNDQRDSSPNNFVAPAVAKQPTYIASSPSFNGLPTIQFDGSQVSAGGGVAPNADELVLSSSTNVQSVVIVSNQTNNLSIAGLWGLDEGDVGIRMNGTLSPYNSFNDPGNGGDFTNAANSTLAVDGSDANNPAAVQNRTHIVSAVRGSATTFTATSIGDYFRVGANAPRSWAGEIGEVIAFNRALSSTERQILDNSLSAKFNVQLAGHDFYAGDTAIAGNYDSNVVGISATSLVNVATGKIATSSSTNGAGPALANDGITDGIYGRGSVFHSAQQADPWWEVDLGTNTSISQVVLYNRLDGGITPRFRELTITVTDAAGTVLFTSPLLNAGNALGDPATISYDFAAANGGNPVVGQKVRVTRTVANIDDNSVLQLAEVQVLSPVASAAVISAGQAGFGMESLSALPLSNMVYAGHKTAINSIVTTDLPAGVTSRWDRVWNVDKTGAGVATRMAFDFTDAGLVAPGAPASYQLLFTPSNAFESGEVAFQKLVIPGTVTGDTVTFDVPASMLSDGYYTVGVQDPNVVINSSAVNGVADTFRIVRSGNQIEIYENGTLVQSSLADGINSITINGSTDDDTLIVDLGGGDVIPLSNIKFNAGVGGNDVLTLNGGANTFGTVTHTFVSATDGSVAITGLGLINYTGLDPINDNLSATDRVFNYTGGGETMTVTDTGGADGMSTITSTLGESVTFVSPTISLTIDVNTGATVGADVITITSIDAAYRASTTILSGTDDTVNLNAALTLGSGTSVGDLSVISGDINITQAINTTAGASGTVTLTALDVLDTSAAADITSGGTVTIAATTQYNLSGDVVSTGDSITISGPINQTANVQIASAGGNVQINGTINDDGVASNRNLTVNAGAGNINFASAIGGTTPLNNLSITGANINAGAIAVATALSVTTTGTSQISGVISGATSLTKLGTGILSLTAENTFTGGTNANEGILNLADPSTGPIGTVRGTVNVAAAGTLRLSTGNALGYGAGTKVDVLNINGGLVDNVASSDNGWGITINMNGGTLRTNNGVSSNSTGQLYSLGNGSAINVLSGTANVQGRINIRESNPGGVLPINVASGATLNYSAATTQQGGTHGITKTGLGTMVLQNASAATAGGVFTVDAGQVDVGPGAVSDGAWAANVAINNGGTLRLLQGNVFNNTSDFTINTGGTFNMNGFSDAIGNLAGGGNITNNNDANGIYLDDLNATHTFSGSISGTGPLIIRGNIANSGTQVFSGGTVALGGLRIGRGTVTFNGPTATIAGVTIVGTNRGDQVGGIPDVAVNAVLNVQAGTFSTVGFELGNSSGSANAIVATINQSGGTVTTTGNVAESNGVRLGHYPQSNTTYNMQGGTLNVNGGVSLSSATDGTGAFIQTGGTVNATQIDVNSRVGTTGNGTFTLNGGTFNLGAGGIVTDGGGGPYTVNLGGGVLVATAAWSSSLNINLTNAVGPAVINTNGFDVTLSGILSGAGGLTKRGNGVLTVSNSASSFSGENRIEGGFLATPDVANSGLNSPLGTNSNIVLTGGSLRYTGSVVDSMNRTITVSAGGGGIDVSNAAGNLTISGNVSGVGQTLAKGGAGTLVLNPTTVSLANFWAAGGNTNFAGSGTFSFTGVLNAGVNTAGVLLVGEGTINVQDAVVVNVSEISINNHGQAGAMTQSGTSDVNVSGLFRVGHWSGGSAAGSYSISGGTLDLTGVPAGDINIAGVGEQVGVIYLGIDGTGAMNISGGTVTAQAVVLDGRGNTSGTDTLNLTGGTLILNSTTANGSGFESGSQNANTSYAINLGGSGTPVVRAANNFASPLNITLNGPNSVAFNTQTFTATLNGLLSGTGGLSKSGGGTLLLGNAGSTYTGNVVIDGGTVRATAGHNNTNATSAFGNPLVARTITANSGTFVEFGASDVFGSATAIPVASIVANSATIQSTGNFFNTLGPITLNGSTLTSTGGFSSGYEAWRLYGTVTVGGTNPSTISAAGTNGGIHLHTNTNFDVADVTGDDNPDLLVSSVLRNQTASQSSAAGDLSKLGAGKLVLTGNNTYGATSVLDGTLLVNNVAGSGTGSGPVVVSGTAILRGTGSIAGTVSMTDSSRLEPGASPETLATGSLSFTAGTTFNPEIGGTAPGNGVTGYDQVNVTGTVSLGGATLDVDLFGGFTPDPLLLQEFVIITNDGTDAVVGTFAGLAEGAAVVVGGSTFYISYSADSAGPGAGNDVALYSQPIINGTAGADIVTVTAADGAGNITVTYSLNNGAVIGGYTTTTPPNAFTFYGGDSDDTLNVNLNAINVALPGGIYYDGEGQGSPVAAGGNPSFGDVLAIVGNGNQTATYTSDAVIARAGTITSDALAGTITFRGLEPVNMFNLASAVVNFGGAADTIDISAGFGATVATSAIPALVVSGNSGGVAFEQVHLSGNIAVEINTVTGGSDAADSVTITSGANAHANANITIDTGVGADTIEVDGPLMVGAGGAISLTSGGSISVNNTITAGLAVTLTALTGSISDGNGASVNVATGLLVAQAATGVANAIDLDTTITSLIVSTTGATNGNININETSGLAVSSATTVNGNITLTAASGDIAVTTITAVGDATLVATTGAITDANAGVLNVSASNLSATSASGIDLDTSIATLTASVTGTGAIDIDEASAITLTSITTNSGLVDITSATGTMTVTSINAAGAVNLAVTDTGAADDDIIVSGTLSSTSNVVLLAGDDATLSGTISATGTVSVTIDAASADVGGAVLSFAGDIDAVSATFTGGAEIDTFNVRPDQDNGLASTPISIFGGNPTVPAGDLLVLDITGLGVPTLTLGAVDYSGVWSFGTSAAGVAYTSIETVQTTPLTSVYNLVLDMRIAGFQNGAADAIEIFLSAPNVFEVEVNGLGKFSGQADTINSFTVIGSSDSESLTIRETAAGLPSFDGAAPLVDNSLASGGVSNGAHLNTAADAYYTASNLTDVTIHFDGGLGDNSLALELLTAADVGYFSDAVDGQGSGNVGVGPSGAPLTLVSFADLDTLILDGAGGNLVVDASSSTSTADIEISDDALLGDGVTEITADTGLVATTTFEGFLALDLIAGGGNEAIDLVNIDSTSSLTSIDIVAGSSLAASDNSAHTVRIHAIKSGVPVTVTGDIGVDTFQVFDSGNSASNIASTLSFNGVAGDDDALIVDDSGSAAADSVVITRTTIEGLTIASGIDITFTSIDDLDVTTSGGADTIRVNMTEAANDLDTAVVTGAGDNDQFYVNAADFLARLTLNGGLGDDTFGGTPSSTAPGYLLSASELDGVDDMIRPSLTTPFFINGNDPTVLPGDVLNIDVSALGGGLAATSPVLVSSGQVLSSTHATVTFTTIEDLNLADDGEMTSATVSDIYIRGTNASDTIQFARANTTLEPNRTRVQIGSSYTYHNVPGKTLVYGRGGNDIINQSNLQIPAEFYGEAGDDFLTGSFNNDLLVGGLGNDRINASSGNNIVWGDDAPTSDELNPHELNIGGNDTLSALGGNDIFYAGGGNDSVSPGAGDDWIHGGYGNDQLSGSSGNDRIYGAQGNDTISGDVGDDFLSGGDGDDRLYGRDGNDVLIGGDGVDLVDGGNGNDLVLAAITTFQGTSDTATSNTYSSAVDAAMLALLVAWNSGGPVAANLTHTDDLDRDTVYGGSGNDLFGTHTNADPLTSDIRGDFNNSQDTSL